MHPCTLYDYTKPRNIASHFCIFYLCLREKSKKFAEQAAAIVCLRTLGLPEGRIGEENSGLVNKRKRDDKPCATLDDSESAARKRHIAVGEEEEMICRTKVVNGVCGQTTP